jgi:hypothetical protein
MIVTDLIQAALRKGGVIASGETPGTSELNDGLQALQVMLRTMAAQKINVFASTSDTLALVSGVALYQWGPTGSITTTRPHQVLGAFVRDSENVDHHLEILAEGQYRNIAQKSTQARPFSVFFKPTYPTALLYFFPTPFEVETVYFDSLKPFTETSSFDSLSAVLSFPVQYEEALIYNLWKRLAPEYGKVVSDDVKDTARDSLNSIITLNAANQVEPVRIQVPAGRGSYGRYSINSDGYC